MWGGIKRKITVGWINRKITAFMPVVLCVVVILLPFFRTGGDVAAMEGVLAALLVGLLLLGDERLMELRFGKLKVMLAEARSAVNEAEKATKEVKEFMKTASVALLSLVKGTGRPHVFSYDQKEQIRKDILARLSDMGMWPAEIANVEKESRWHEFVAVDYVVHILQGRHFPSNDAFTEGQQLHEAIELRKRPLPNVATPDELEAFLSKCNVLTEQARGYIEDYRYYVEHHEQRRPQVWANRDEWYQSITRTD